MFYVLSEYFNKLVGVIILTYWGFFFFNLCVFDVMCIFCWRHINFRLFHVAPVECYTPRAAGGARILSAQHCSRRQRRFECGTIACDPTTSCQSLSTSPLRELVLHHGRNTAAKRAGQRATGSSCRANLPACGEDNSGVPGRSRPLQKRGYRAEKASGTAVRFESQSNIK